MVDLSIYIHLADPSIHLADLSSWPFLARPSRTSRIEGCPLGSQILRCGLPGLWRRELLVFWWENNGKHEVNKRRFHCNRPSQWMPVDFATCISTRGIQLEASIIYTFCIFAIPDPKTSQNDQYMLITISDSLMFSDPVSDPFFSQPAMAQVQSPLVNWEDLQWAVDGFRNLKAQLFPVPGIVATKCVRQGIPLWSGGTGTPWSLLLGCKKANAGGSQRLKWQTLVKWTEIASCQQNTIDMFLTNLSD